MTPAYEAVKHHQRCREMLVGCAKQFELYAAQHRSKADEIVADDPRPRQQTERKARLDKAATNNNFALEIRRLLDQ